MNRPELLDLFCCGGGASAGYHRAGFSVTGIDIEPQPDYPFTFVQADAIEVLGYLVRHEGVAPWGQRYDVVAGSPPCFPAGTPVVAARGVIAIEAVHVGDLVLTHEGRWRRVLDTMSRQADVYADGWLAATADHPFWARQQIRRRAQGRQGAGGGPKATVREVACEVCEQPTTSKYGVCQKTAACRRALSSRSQEWSLGDPAWTPASEMHRSFVAVPEAAEPLPIPPVPGGGISLDCSFWWMVGRWVGDGWLRISSAPRTDRDVIICCADSEADDLKSRLADTGLNWICSRQRTAVRFTVRHAGLTGWLADNFGRGAAGKTIPGWLLGADPDIRQALLDGYASADGGSTVSGRAITTVSTGLAFGVRLLATSLGYGGTVYRVNPPPKKIIEGRTVNQRPWWRVSLHRDDRYTRSDGQYRWVKRRRAMAYRGRETVYDLTVEEDHSFVAWGFVVHNCQGYSKMSNCRPGLAGEYPQLIDVVRGLLTGFAGPWVIENVDGSGLAAQDDLFGSYGVLLCGTMFGRQLYRHRLFEVSFPIRAPHHPRHVLPASKAGRWRPGTVISVTGHCAPISVAREAMGIDWMPRQQLKEAIPPDYTAYIGARLLEHMAETGAAR